MPSTLAIIIISISIIIGVLYQIYYQSQSKKINISKKKKYDINTYSFDYEQNKSNKFELENNKYLELIDEIELEKYSKINHNKSFLDYKSIFLSGKLMDLKIFQINQFYYEEKNQNLFIFEGIEFKFNKGYFSIGFSSENEYNMFQATSFKELYENENEFEINNEETIKLSNLIGKNIVDVKFKAIDFNEVVDYTMKLEKVSRIVEIILYFEDNQTLQIATVNYDFEKDTVPKNYRYDITGELLISLNNIQKIKQILTKS